MSTLMLIAVVAAATWIYRGPSPQGLDSDRSRPSAGRMRAALVSLIGENNDAHSLATSAGIEFLERLESRVQSMGHTTRRIEIPLAGVKVPSRWLNRLRELPEGAVLRNLLVTVPGRDPKLAPLLVATHHDSCTFGPGAGDAGIAVVALVEHLRIMAITPPRRTTQYLFTDGEEYGLLGAAAIAGKDPLPIRKPCFVINMDARGCSGGIPMFETHPDNRAAVSQLSSSLAFPKITSSLAVTVYRLLPNATDFNVWDQQLHWPGFNFAVIGGAHRYHRPEDIPANVSDRTLQHMGDHLYRMHAAIDNGDDADWKPLQPGDAVFFDLLGITVLHFGSPLQSMLSVIALLIMLGVVARRLNRKNLSMVGQLLIVVMLVLLAGYVIGMLGKILLLATPWRSLRYTPVDHVAGLMTMAFAFLTIMLGLESTTVRKLNWSPDVISDAIWLGVCVIGAVLSYYLPGGAYLLVLPGLVYSATRIALVGNTHSARIAAWCGWSAMILLTGPLLTLLVQALGPWQQPVYAVAAGLLVIIGMTTWLTQPQRETIVSTR